MAGAKYEKGDKNGKMMPGSLCSTWCSIDWQKWRKNKPDMPQPQSFKVKEAYEAGVFSFYDPHMTGIFEIGDGLGGGNIGHAFGVDGTDEGSVTRALLHCRKSMREYKNYYNKYVPGFENAKVVSTGSAMGIRETRRFVGDYTLNIDDYMKRAVFDDEIGRYAYPIDIHPSSFDKGELERHRQEFDKLYKYAKGESYGIPYRILTPKGFDNLYTAGRCASSDELVHGSIRVMPACATSVADCDHDTLAEIVSILDKRCKASLKICLHSLQHSTSGLLLASYLGKSIQLLTLELQHRLQIQNGTYCSCSRCDPAALFQIIKCVHHNINRRFKFIPL